MKKFFKLLIFVNLTFIFTQNALAFDPYYSSTGDGVTVDVSDGVVSMSASNPTTSGRRTAYQFIPLAIGTDYYFSLGYHLGTPDLTGGISNRTQQIQFGFASNNKGWDGFSYPENYEKDPNFETFRFSSVVVGTNVSKDGIQQNYWGTSNSMGLEYMFPYNPPDCHHGLSCSVPGYSYFPLNSIDTAGKPRSNADGSIYGSYNSTKDELSLLAVEKRKEGGFTDPTLIALLKPKANGLSNFFVGGLDITDAKITAAPEPVTTTLFLVGGGLMGLDRLRRKKA